MGVGEPRGAQRLDKWHVEDIGERAPDRRLPRKPVEAFERAIPPDDPLPRVEHDEPIVERLEDVVVELAHAAELLGLQVELTIEPAVLDRGGYLACDRREQLQVL